MEIVAQSKKGYLFEATADEIARMLGQHNDFHRTYKSDAPKLHIGMKFNIDKAWDRLQAIERIPQTLRQLEELSKTVALAVSTSIPFVEHALDPKPEEKET
jgi:hypothetical protein